ncbi:glutamine amidotransferase-related protein, partial [Staphylococcus aureus]
SDSITTLPAHFSVLATTESIPIAAFKSNDDTLFPLYGLQFHPEVYHSTECKKIISNFLTEICGCAAYWTPNSFIEETVAQLKETIGD